MIPSLDLTGGAGGAAGPATSGGGRFDSRAGNGEGTSGQRGFVNNFAAAGSKLSAEAGINAPLGSGFPWTWAALAAVAVVLWWFHRRNS